MYARCLLAIAVFTAFALPARAAELSMGKVLFQTSPERKTPEPPQKEANAKRRPTPRNVLAGTLVSVDTEAATLTIKPRTGPNRTFRYDEKTHVLRAKRPAEIDAFKPGETVVARFRRSSVAPPDLYDLADQASWQWLDRIRHSTTLVTVKEITEEELRATEGADAAEVTYRITDKTQWGKGGQAASAGDFKSGDRVHVVPRLLPGGSLMALAVSDAPETAARLKERTRYTVTGTVKAYDRDKRLLSLRTAAGDDRELALAPDCVAHWTTKTVPVAVLTPGQTVTAHLTRNEEGEQVVTRITIHSSPRAPRRRSGTPMPGGRPR